jgi:hypothetical protein
MKAIFASVVLLTLWIIAHKWTAENKELRTLETVATIRNIVSATEEYYRDNGALPESFSDLSDVVNGIRFIEPHEKLDGWGHEIRFAKIPDKAEVIVRWDGNTSAPQSFLEVQLAVVEVSDGGAVLKRSVISNPHGLLEDGPVVRQRK